MSRPIYFICKTDKNMNMQTNMSKWFEKKYLEWQLEFGISNLSSFAKHIGVSQSYISQLINGTRKSLSMKTAQSICEKLNDWTLYDILGYRRDFSSTSIPLESLSDDLRSRLILALHEIRKTVNERSLDPESPEAKTISEEVLKKHGFIVNSNNLS